MLLCSLQWLSGQHPRPVHQQYPPSTHLASNVAVVRVLVAVRVETAAVSFTATITSTGSRRSTATRCIAYGIRPRAQGSEGVGHSRPHHDTQPYSQNRSNFQQGHSLLSAQPLVSLSTGRIVAAVRRAQTTTTCALTVSTLHVTFLGQQTHFPQWEDAPHKQGHFIIKYFLIDPHRRIELRSTVYKTAALPLS